MIEPLTITLIEDPDEAVIAAIREPLSAFNLARTAVPVDYRPFAFTLTAPGTDRILGGAWGWSYYAYLFLDLLFIPESHRGCGLGTRLMAEVEAEALRRTCVGLYLDTFDWQARPFYERLGFEVFGTLDDFPPGHRRFFLTKRLSPAQATAPKE